MHPTLVEIDNDASRTFNVFFYGLYMDADILASRNVVARDPRIAYIDGHVVKLGEKAKLLRSTNGRAHGMLFRLTHGEMKSLYGVVHGYSAEPFLAVTADGQTVAAISMVQVSLVLHPPPDPGYAERWNELVVKLGLPNSKY